MPSIVIGKPNPPNQGAPGQGGMPGGPMGGAPSQPKPTGGGISFGSKPKQSGPDVGQMVEDVAEITRRIRTMEERYNTLQTKTQFIEHNMLSYHKQAIGETKTISSDFREIKREIEEMKNKILAIIKEMEMCAKKNEVKVLERYINLWEPVHFVTRHEVDEMIKEALNENK